MSARCSSRCWFRPAAALVFGLIPALFVGRADVSDALKVGGRTSSASPGRMGVWNFLVVGEIALASMLLIGAGLAMKSFVNLQRVNPGIRPDHVLTFRMRLPTDNLYKSSREQAQFYRRVLDKVQALPGIQSAGLTDVLPLGQQNDREYFTIENRPLPPGAIAGGGLPARQPAIFRHHGDRVAAGKDAHGARPGGRAVSGPDRRNAGAPVFPA